MHQYDLRKLNFLNKYVMKKLKKVLKNIFSIIVLSFKYAPLLSVLWIVLYIILTATSFLFPILQTILIEQLNISYSIGMELIIITILISFSSFIFQPIISLFTQYLDIYYFSLFGSKLTKKMMNNHISNIKYDSMLNQKDYSKIEFCYNKKNEIVRFFRSLLYATIMLFSSKIIYVILVFRYSITLGIISALYLVFRTIYDLKINKKVIEFEKNIIPIQRKKDYYNSLIFNDKNNFKLKSLNIEDEIYEKCSELIDEYNDLYLKNKIKEKKAKYKLDIIRMILIYLGMFFIVYMNINEHINLSVAIYLFTIYKSSLSSLTYFSKTITKTVKSSLYVDEYDILLNDNDHKLEVNDNIEFQHLSLRNINYKYINGDVNALDGINIDIHKGEVISILGENGSGKTTLSKIILGILKNYGGEIFLNGKKLDKTEINHMYGCAFQDYYKYSFKLYENILISDVKNINNNEKIEEVKENFLIKSIIEKLPNGLYTNMDKNLFSDGVDLSGGEWQKIILARAMASNRQIFILDEPTASIDPEKEKEILDFVKTISTYCTTIIISHRIPFAKIADKIYMMKEGKIIENGTHEELLKLKGEYYKTYNMQKELYDI